MTIHCPPDRRPKHVRLADNESSCLQTQVLTVVGDMHIRSFNYATAYIVIYPVRHRGFPPDRLFIECSMFAIIVS